MKKLIGKVLAASSFAGFAVSLGIILMVAAGDAGAQYDPLLDVEQDAYGHGVNRDQYGRPHQYETQQGRTLDPVEQDGVKRNAYGLGVHKDKYGRPAYDRVPSGTKR